MDKIFKIGLLVLAWSMGLVQVANAEPYGETKSLNEWGISNYTINDFQFVKWRDETDEISGSETKLEFYRKEKDNKLVGFYSITIKKRKFEYAVGMMPDFKNPKKLSIYVDLNGDGRFTLDMSRIIEKVPDWVMKEYRKSITPTPY